MRVEEKPQTLSGGEHIWVKLAPLFFGSPVILNTLFDFSRVLFVVADGNGDFVLRQVAFFAHPFWPHVFVRFNNFPHVEGGAFHVRALVALRATKRYGRHPTYWRCPFRSAAASRHGVSTLGLRSKPCP